MMTRARSIERKAAGISILVVLQVRGLITAARRDEVAVAAGQGALADLISLRFAEWHLTAAEADVALFALKGCDIAEIATFGGTAAGTAPAQLTRVYATAGVNSHSGLIALFLEELIPPSGGGTTVPAKGSRQVSGAMPATNRRARRPIAAWRLTAEVDV